MESKRMAESVRRGMVENPLRNRIYYVAKPFLPRTLRMAFRRLYARWIRRGVGSCWPVLPDSGRPHEHWPGWPDDKRFALVLTHDVESPEGLNQVKELAELEMEYGLRSSFNFVPEGSYRVPSELRHWLTDRGFEVGIHDLHHDGKLYSSRKEFQVKAVRINRYLSEWDAVGFRSAFMLHNLEWLHELDIGYDLSSFDTDPFEPQPDGVKTIFPFKVRLPEGGRQLNGSHNRGGYIEMPYTLPQDSTLFLLLGERGGQLWKRKLSWIVAHGGMALLNVHPDYLQFDGSTGSALRYPAAWYREFLEHVCTDYLGSFWNTVPKKVADFANLISENAGVQCVLNEENLRS